MYPPTLREEEIKNKVASDFFKDFDSTKILGNIDFCISFNNKTLFEPINFLWSEAKAGKDRDIYKSLVQLILTIGKSKINQKVLPPLFLGAFDCEKFAFLPYYDIMNVFSQNDFNWNVTPSNYETKEFQQLYQNSKNILEEKSLYFNFEKDYKNLKDFIKNNFTLTNNKLVKIPINKNNFTHVYKKWLNCVKDSISISWEDEKPDILDADFYLADLLSFDNTTKGIKENLRILLQKDSYKVKIERVNKDRFNFTEFYFKDKQLSHTQFWNLYERPPKEEFWDYILERRDLLVPQDIRERKGAFFTPQIWVNKSQSYLASSLGENFQDEYYIWDLAAGTGNLLANLVESNRIFASTLDRSDVEIMKDLAKNKRLNLLENHIFQFDFLNDDFFDEAFEKSTHVPPPPHKALNNYKILKESKLPKLLQEILKDKNKRQKLIILINPPYAEATSATTIGGTGEHKTGVALGNQVGEKYKDILGNARNEIFAQFFIRIYKEIDGCILAQFSTLKIVQGRNFIKFRDTFRAKFLSGFIVPAGTFDNVKGEFPIGFMIWDLSKKESLKTIELDIFDNRNNFLGIKKFYGNNKENNINVWIKEFDKKIKEILAFMGNPAPDFQHNNLLHISCNKSKGHFNFYEFNSNNVIYGFIYFAVRHAIPSTWINDRDQFLYPNDKWIKDSTFQSDCLAFSLFHSQNRITCKIEVNHFIPFSESEVQAKEAFESNFIYKFIQGKIKNNDEGKIPNNLGFIELENQKINFSNEAKAVFSAGLELWQYYHKTARDTKEYLNNASFYDIKEFFQGRSYGINGKSRMNNKSDDSHYTFLLSNLRNELKYLSKKIELKTYEYGFLKE